MHDENNCNKTIIADLAGFKIVFCENHQMIELIIGGMSLRLDLDNFNNLNELLNIAYRNLNIISGSDKTYNELLIKLKNKSH
jgi:hypothetical protein